jgi:multiple sugar transport system ATP-binding protein
VRFEKVAKRYGGQAALHEIDIEVEPGECMVLLGPSGCGKNTLLRLLAGLETPDAGRLWIGEREVTDLPPAERDVAMVFQNYKLKRLQQELGTTTLYVTHDQGEAMTLGRRVALLRAGAIEQVATPLELYRRPATRFAATFVGTPPLNLWPVTAASDAASSGRATVLGTARSVPAEIADAIACGRRVEVGVRPEDVALTGAGPHAVEARVLVVEPMGSETVIPLEGAGQRVTPRTSADHEPPPGSTVWIAADLAHAVFFGAENGQRIRTA